MQIGQYKMRIVDTEIAGRRLHNKLSLCVTHKRSTIKFKYPCGAPNRATNSQFSISNNYAKKLSRKLASFNYNSSKLR